MPKRSTVRLNGDVVDAAQPGESISDSGLPGLRLIVSPAGTKRFVAVYRVKPKDGERGGGRASMMALGCYPTITVQQARTLAQGPIGQAKAGIDPGAAREALRSAPTLDDLATYYQGEYARAENLSRSTLEGAKAALRFALPKHGKRKLLDFTPADIRKLHTAARDAGLADARARVAMLEKAIEAAVAKGDGRAEVVLRGKLARVQARVDNRAGVYQANRLLAVLSAMFNIAKADSLRWRRTDNPCASLAKFREDQRWRNLSEGEVGRLLDACDAYEQANAMEPTAREAADAIRLLLYTGARLREVLRAEWGQFNLEAGLWEKPSSHTKTKRQHRLSIDGPALDTLKGMKERASHTRYLFPGRPVINGKPIAAKDIAAHPTAIKPRADLKRPWAWIIREAGLSDVRIHDLRRTTATFMLSGGAALATVGKALGHTQAATTARYAQLHDHVQRDGLRQAGEAMAALAGRGRVASNVTPLR